MEGSSGSMERELEVHPLHTVKVETRAIFNRVHSLVYICAILALFYHRFLLLLHSTTSSSFTLYLSMLISELVLAFMWLTTLSFRLRPIRRQAFPENLSRFIQDEDFPSLDVFICTADPYKEPPMAVVNTALSVMAFDFPTRKLSVYVSDDGGSQLTLFAFMEAAKFARHWLPFCRENGIKDRAPEAYFGSTDYNYVDELKVMYESMKKRVERAMDTGRIMDEYITTDIEREAFKKWTDGFTRQDHPTVIQVLLESNKDMDVTGHELPNLVYVSREKSRSSPHHFKAGALNVLLRVSGAMSNAPVVLTLDCDMYSNDPQSPRRALCYLLDPVKASKLGFVQFPQRYQGINKNDIYASELKRLFIINPLGMDGLRGTSYVGTGCFFNRKVFSGGPSSSPLEDSHSKSNGTIKNSSPLMTEVAHYKPNGTIDNSLGLGSEAVLQVALKVASSTYENGTNWGSKMGFRYGSLVEDYYTGYRVHCEGWESVFCHPKKAAFLGDVPINLNDALSQNKRWCIGLLEVAFSKFSPLTFGATRISVLMGLCYAHYAFWSAWSIPMATYGFLPQLALLNQIQLFPKVSDPWFYLYAYLFVGAYGQDLFDFLTAGSTIRRWWNDQRMWMIRGVSSYLFGLIQFSLKHIGISGFGFNLTSKVIDDDESKRYGQEIFEFGVASPMFVSLATVSIINFLSFSVGLSRALVHGHIEDMFVQLFISGFVVVNSWPIYEAMVLRRDKGSMPLKITVISAFLAWALYLVSSLFFKA